MGAWGKGVWENDDALDWLGGLTEPVELAGAFVACLSDEADAGDCCTGLAAAELISAAYGRAGLKMPERGVDWVHTHRGELEGSLVYRALEAVVEQRNDQEVPGAGPVHRGPVQRVQAAGDRPADQWEDDSGRKHRGQRGPQAGEG